MVDMLLLLARPVMGGGAVLLAFVAAWLSLRSIYLKTPNRLAWIAATGAAWLIAEPVAHAQATGHADTFYSLRTAFTAAFCIVAGGLLFFARCKATGMRYSNSRLVYMSAIAGAGALAVFWAALEWSPIAPRGAAILAMGAAFLGGEAVLKKLGLAAEDSISLPSKEGVG